MVTFWCLLLLDFGTYLQILYRCSIAKKEFAIYGLVIPAVQQHQYTKSISRFFQIDIFMNGEHVEEYQDTAATNDSITPGTHSSRTQSKNLPRGNCTFRLEDLAYTRSGDKGNSVNIGTEYTLVYIHRSSRYIHQTNRLHPKFALAVFL